MIDPKRAYVALIPAFILLVAGCGQQDSSAQDVTDPAVSLPKVALEQLETDAAPRSQGGNCSLDTINGQPVATASVGAGEEAIFVGWVGDAEGQVPLEAKLVLTGGSGAYAAPVQTGTERPDVVAALGKPGLASSGFGVSTVLSVEPGTYRVSIVMGAAPVVQCQFDVNLELAAR